VATFELLVSDKFLEVRYPCQCSYTFAYEASIVSESPTSVIIIVILNVKCSVDHVVLFCSFAGACQLVIF
jgi:hypothetical protein